MSRAHLALGKGVWLRLPLWVWCSLTSEKRLARGMLLKGSWWTRRSDRSRWMYPGLCNAWLSGNTGIGWWLRHVGRHWLLLLFHSISLDSLLLLNVDYITYLVIQILLSWFLLMKWKRGSSQILRVGRAKRRITRRRMVRRA